VTHAHSIQWQRYEAKYLLPAAQAMRILEYCRKHLPPDPYSASSPDRQYPVYSVYLDSPDWILLQSTIDRSPKRFKLRMRTYRRPGDSADGLNVYFEIKRKVYGVVHKTRSELPYERGSCARGFRASPICRPAMPSRATT
jgi:hypothetical protein